jgi:glutaminase
VIPHLQETLQELYTTLLPNRDGRIADYIPELSRANPDHFGIAVTEVSGKTFKTGDTEVPFTLQSVSKPFVYALALKELGAEAVHKMVGTEPTGMAFNSIIRLEEGSDKPHNPMINAGAIAVTDLLKTPKDKSRLDHVLEYFSDYAGTKLHLDEKTYLSERLSGHKNRAIAHLLRQYNRVGEDFEASLDLYFQHCSIVIDTAHLSQMAATLANGGIHPTTLKRVIDARHVKDVLSLMFTCGMYDSSGEWAYAVGIPAKSGVSGALMAVVPGKMGIATFSPLLNRQGHSVRGSLAIRALSEKFGLSVF